MLSNSFDYPEGIKIEKEIRENGKNLKNNKESQKIIKKEKEVIQSSSKAKVIKIGSRSEKSEKELEIKLNRSNQFSQNKFKRSRFKPKPYRIIIKLSGTNPSAPAEIVTEALRQAGIEFEVEKIERFEIRSDPKTFPVKG